MHFIAEFSDGFYSSGRKKSEGPVIPKRPANLDPEFDNVAGLEQLIKKTADSVATDRARLQGNIETKYTAKNLQKRIREGQRQLEEYQNYYRYKKVAVPNKGGALVKLEPPRVPPQGPPRRNGPSDNPALIKDTYNVASATKRVKKAPSILPALAVAGLAGLTLNKLLPMQNRSTLDQLPHREGGEG